MATAETKKSVLQDFLQKCNLKIACSLCAKKETQITYSLKDFMHQCNGDLLLAKDRKNGQKWRHVSRRPLFPNPSKYDVCHFFVELSGCTKHRNRCTFASSPEEVMVWNFQKRHQVDHGTLVQLLTDSQKVVVEKKNVAEKILIEFGGEFKELCETCFYSCPQKVSVKRWNNTCASETAHSWEPLLTHYLADGNMKVYNEIRPPHFHGLQYCNFVAQGFPCWHRFTCCQFAHSEVEMAVWKAEVAGECDRRELVLLSQERKPSAVSSEDVAADPVEIYCKACLLTVSSKESFVNHCASVEHALMISGDTSIEWKYRRPPHNRKQEFLLCDRPDTCDYGVHCVRAHSAGELAEWFMQTKEAEEMRHTIGTQGLMSYRDLLLEEYRNSANEVHVMSEMVDDVSITHDEELCARCDSINAEVKWVFQIKTERLLSHVALLKQEPGAIFSLGENQTEEPCTYSTGERFCTSDISFDIPVYFKPINPGIYEQWLVFDFDMRPVLLQKLHVRVGEQTSSQLEEMPEGIRAPTHELERWQRGNRVIIPCLIKKEAEEELLKNYKPPLMNLQFNPAAGDSRTITTQNYRERMHSFLYREELAQEELASRLSLQATVSFSDQLYDPDFGLKVAPAGDLFATVPVSCALTPDTPEGFVLRRAIRSSLLCPLSRVSQHQVYEAAILRDASSENKIFLQLSRRCCSDLGLQKDTTCEMEIQFQINRLTFCEMHEAVDLLPDVEKILPDLQHCCVPAHRGEFPKLNSKQHAAMSFIIGDSDGRTAPLLIYGPFGTGKTFTLAIATKEVVRQPGTRVLICTHTNSSADLYVKDHFHPYVNAGHPEATPLRIKAEKAGVSVSATEAITLQYCHRSHDSQSFLIPDRATLDKFRVVITTAVMARKFHDLKLPPGYFSHILIDEASQMLECEALMPLSLAEAGTRVVLAGDHMQMGPKLFSVEEDQRSSYTVLNRLFHYYQEQKNPPALKSRIIFHENYRSTEDIVDFVSTHFYVGKSDVIKASGQIPPHPHRQPLRFHHVRGECLLDKATMSWFNPEEISSVVEIVQNLLKEWPSQWGNPEQRTICVLSEGCQVFLIRKELRKRNLSKITVENVENVQGKQFRAVVMTTVHTRDSLLSSDTACLEFFNDPRVLNTAMTRAQSQVIVVGDAAALCIFGKCPKIWKSYVEQCIGKGSADPPHLTVDFLEQEIREIQGFLKVENKYDGDKELSDAEDTMDEILQQLIEDHNAIKDVRTVGDTSESDDSEFPQQTRAYESEAEKDALIFLAKKQPSLYTHGELVMETSDTGHVMPFDNPAAHIKIKGRINMGRSFSGDEVVVEKFPDEKDFGKVLGVTKSDESSRVFVCTVEDEYHQTQKVVPDGQYVTMVMVPINKNVTKIRILCNKKKRNFIPIWKCDDGNWKVTENRFFSGESKRNHVFVVKVVCWKEHCRFPLGFVTDVLPIGTSVEEVLKVLDGEFRLTPPPPNYMLTCSDVLTDDRSRMNLQDVTTFTVDSQTSRDLDDAISVRELGSNYELGVHIADVASFVSKGSKLDSYACKIGATYYPPNREPVHMLPKQVSTDLCSLLPMRDRRAISLLIKVEKDTDKIIDSHFTLSLIKSNKKLSYEEAEDIIVKHSRNGLQFGTLEDCVAVAYHFSRAHRKDRLGADWCYAQLDDRRSPGRRKSHQMIEELMILFNNSVSEFLTGDDDTDCCTPLRCQAKPSVEIIKSLQEKYDDLIPMSIHLTYHISPTEQRLKGKNFFVLSSLWEELQDAAKKKEVDRIVDLIATDDIHPQLLPVTLEFRKSLGKSYFIRSNSAPEAKIGHYSLELNSYTYASSPIRRYLDVILQRLLHAKLCRTPVQYSTQEISILCQQFDNNQKKADDYRKKAETCVFAVSLRKQNVQKHAFVTAVEPEGDGFKVSFPFDKGSLPDALPVLYRDLQLEDQPVFNKEKNAMHLTWKRRVYSLDTAKTYLELKKLLRCNPCIYVAQKAWQDIIEALRMEDWDTVFSLVRNTDTKPVEVDSTLENVDSPCKKQSSGKMKSTLNPRDIAEIKHYVDLALSLKLGDTLQVQMTTETRRGFCVPAIQLLNVNAKFEICLDHAHNPIDCFSNWAKSATRNYYHTVEEYVKIWKPLCEMESAANAVDDSDCIIIEDLEVTWTHHGSRCEGSFSLPLNCVKDWAIECNLAKCLLCVRKRNLRPTTYVSHEFEEKVNPSYFTWVAHGVTTGVSDSRKNSPKKSKEVKFYISHMSMESTPGCVLDKNNKFTVEIIPKLLPDVRKESAINNLSSASELVQNIALGHRIPRGASESPVPKWKMMKMKKPDGLPSLNESQYSAIEQALKNHFTLIQGPPGTGKTVVGAYIVYWFFSLNTTNPRLNKDKEERDKREVILYCGPSNKSVDVVAEYLMKFEGEFKPLRVYSRQMEMLEYPYPGSILQLSRKSLRQERSKQNLRSITLHHRIRGEENPHSPEILAFDKRIKLSQESEGAELTEEEVEAYKKLLNQARLHELKKHDVILCTCTTASTPNLRKTVSARQILIDECAMSTEPQALVPLVSHKPEKVVLLGDHKQLRPIVKNEHVRKFGMSKSLFERYMGKAVMLDTQYRMHKDICSFPSMEYYMGSLKTAVDRPNSVLKVSPQRRTQILFGHICGEEVRLVVTTEKGNENSKANREEGNMAVHIAQLLVNNSKIHQENIAILSPYNAQVTEIKDKLKERRMNKITVSTITKSQGSEWPYVILSTVRSLPSSEIEKDPSRAWLSKNVGFVGDPNQVNVGITRAQEGLCIIGNQELLNCSTAWRHLLKHYTAHNCVTMARNISTHTV